MNKASLWGVLGALGLGLCAGYWLALEFAKPFGSTTMQTQPMGDATNVALKPKVPTSDPIGADTIPSSATTEPNATRTAMLDASFSNRQQEILYYRHPMGLPDISPVPKKDSMGMDYVPVYADETSSNEAAGLRISTEKIQRLGVKTALTESIDIARTVHALGIVEVDERLLHEVTTRFDGFIEKVHVQAAGQSVTRGQALFEVYSPDLVSAQNEYLLAEQSRVLLAKGRDWLKAGVDSLAHGSLERLKNWGISARDLNGLQHGEIFNTLIVRSPASGVILEKNAIAGARVLAGDTLFKIADLSSVWIKAEVYEQDIDSIQPGQAVRISLDAFPERLFHGVIDLVDPMLNATTRTLKVRIEVANPENLFKPMMYARASLDAPSRRALAVPESALLDSGRRTLVLVERGEGRFEARVVKVGQRGVSRVGGARRADSAPPSEDWVEILEGLEEKERVVISANFLLDAESNLNAALGAFESSDKQHAACAEPCATAQPQKDELDTLSKPGNPEPASRLVHPEGD